jgi:hypothetical protein
MQSAAAAAPASAALATSAPTPRPGGFTVTGEMLSLAGCSLADFEDVLKAIGYRRIALKAPDGSETVIFRPARQGHEPQRGAREEAKRARPRAKRSEAPPQISAPEQPAPAQQLRTPDQSAPPAERARDVKGREGSTRGQGDRGKGPKRHEGELKSRPDRGPPKPAFDKDSPFAVLAQLKDNLRQK